MASSSKDWYLFGCYYLPGLQVTNEKLAVKMCRLDLTPRNKDRWSKEIQIMKKLVFISYFVQMSSSLTILLYDHLNPQTFIDFSQKIWNALPIRSFILDYCLCIDVGTTKQWLKWITMNKCVVATRWKMRTNCLHWLFTQVKSHQSCVGPGRPWGNKSNSLKWSSTAGHGVLLQRRPKEGEKLLQLCAVTVSVLWERAALGWLGNQHTIEFSPPL